MSHLLNMTQNEIDVLGQMLAQSTTYKRFGMQDENELIEILKTWLEESPLFGINWCIRPGYPDFLLQLNRESFFEVQGTTITGVHSKKQGWKYDVGANMAALDKMLGEFKVNLADPDSLTKLGIAMNYVEYYKLSPIYMEWQGKRAIYSPRTGRWSDE